MSQKTKFVAVLISDIHFSLPTLEVASKALQEAIGKANLLEVPLIIAGDLHDTKANMRGECVKVILDLLESCNKKPIVIAGNHDRLNEKHPAHALEFLRNTAVIVDSWDCYMNLHLVPYYHDKDELLKTLKHEAPEEGDILIMHQGIKGSNSGDYIRDHSAITKEDVAGLRIASGHYHNRQTIKLPKNGTWDYIGNPYSLNFGEASDPPKGFQILYSDGSLEFVPTNLRKHVVFEIDLADINLIRPKPFIPVANPEDIIWVKVKGPRNRLSVWDKKSIGRHLELTQDFRLDLIPTDVTIQELDIIQLSDAELLAKAIDSAVGLTIETRHRLQSLWKALQ